MSKLELMKSYTQDALLGRGYYVPPTLQELTELLAHIERLEAKIKRFEQAGIRWRKEQVEETFDQWIEDDLTHWISDQDAAWQAWMYIHEWKVFPMMKRIERLEAAVQAVKDWDIENFKERGAFVVPQEIRQMIQAATRGEGK